MRGGRDTHHHPQALRGGLRAALGLLALLGVVCPAAAGEQQKLARAGRVHRVQSVVTGNGPSAGSAIVHRVQFPDGTVTTEYLPGTDDPRPDVEPALEMDPVTDQPIVVWARESDGDLDIVLSRLEDGSWSAPRAVGVLAGHDRTPHVKVTPNRIHIVWRHDTGRGVEAYRISLDRATLATIYGPEALRLDDPDPVAPSGQPGSEPPHDAVFFAVPLTAAIGGIPPRVYVWGIQEEPVPVGYVESFDLPEGTTSAERADAGWVGGRFAVWFVSDGALRYSYRVGQVWTDLRQIELDSHTPESEAVAMLEEMLQRPQAAE